MSPDADQLKVLTDAARGLAGMKVRLELDGVQMFMLSAQLQLALRHPENAAGKSAMVARAFISLCVDAMEKNGLTDCARFLRMGDDPVFDGLV